MAKVKYSDGTIINFSGNPNSQEIEEAYNSAKEITKTPEMVRGLFGSVPKERYESGERNWMGNIAERPGAMAREAIRENPISALAGPLAGLSDSERARRAAINPSLSPTFQQESIDKFTPPGGFIPTTGKGMGGKLAMGANTILNAAVGAPGAVADVVTDPFQTLVALVTGGAFKAVAPTKAGQAVERFAKLPLKETLPGRIITKGVKATKRIPSEAQDILAHDIAGYSKPTLNTIEKHGIGKVSDVANQADTYLTKEIIPQARKVTIDQITSKNTKYLEDLGFKPEEISDLQSVSPERLAQLKDNISSSTSWYELNKNLNMARRATGKRIGEIVDLAEMNGISFPVPKTLGILRKKLSEMGLVDMQGNLLADAENIQSSTIKGLIKVYRDMSSLGYKGEITIPQYRNYLTNLEASIKMDEQFNSKVYPVIKALRSEGVEAMQPVAYLRKIDLKALNRRYYEDKILQDLGDRLNKIYNDMPENIETSFNKIRNSMNLVSRDKAIKIYGKEFVDKIDLLSAAQELYIQPRGRGFWNALQKGMTKSMFWGKQATKPLSSLKNMPRIRPLSSLRNPNMPIGSGGILPKARVPFKSLSKNTTISPTGEGLSIFPKPIEQVSSKPLIGSGKGWVSDRGVMPGEPISIYKNKGAIVELVDDEGNVLYQGVDESGNVLGVFPELKSAKLKVEQVIDKLSQPTGEGKVGPRIRP